MESFLNWEYMPLIPPLLTLLLVIVTRKVGISLGAGIITSAFVIANGHFGEFFRLVFDSFIAIFIEDGGLNTWNAYILIFLTLLGIMTAFMNMSGGARAFTNWALTKVKSRRGAGLMTAVLGIIVFIDDYFSALIVGQVAKPITDKYKISRAKLAYMVDTTASPVAVMMPGCGNYGTDGTTPGGCRNDKYFTIPKLYVYGANELLCHFSNYYDVYRCYL